MRRLAAVAALIAAIACTGGSPSVCRLIDLSAKAAAAMPGASARLDFPPLRPCAFDVALSASSVFIDMLPGSPPQPRINFVVTRDAETAFVLSQTRALVPFSAVPQGSRRIRVNAGRGVAEGFAGPSGSGVEIAYLRWRLDGVTYELDATLRSWLTEEDVRAIAGALMVQ
jgi:hypothetical protein